MTNRPTQPLPLLVIGAEYETPVARFTIGSVINTESGVQIQTASSNWMYLKDIQAEMIRMPCPYCGGVWNLHSTEFEINLAEHIARNHQ